MNELIKIIHEWQTLTGAFIGGVFSLSVALIVARSVKRAEDHSATIIVISNLVQYISRIRVLKQLAKDQKIPEIDYGKWVSEKLTYSKPKLSGTFEASIARLVRIHSAAAAHLELFYMLARDIDDHIDRISKDFANFHTHGKPKRPLEIMETDAKAIAAGLAEAELHADFAEYMLTKLVLGNYPTFYRIRRRLFPSKKDKQSISALLQSNR